MNYATTGREAPILVTGGTGTLGRLVVARLRDAGREVRVLSRRIPGERHDPGVEYVTADLATGAGTDAALDGIDVVMHLAGGAKGDDEKARHLLSAASGAGVQHVVYISVVGTDRIPVLSAIDRAMFGYFASKATAERLIAHSGIPFTMVRATQFQASLLKVIQGMASLPLVPVPAGWRFQPIDAGEVADRLVELALGKPAGLVPDLGGPRIHGMADLVRSYLQATGRRPRPIISLPMPGKAASAFRAGANLAPDRAVGRRTWEELLTDGVSDTGTAQAGSSDMTGATGTDAAAV